MKPIDAFVQDVNEFQREFNDAIDTGQRLCFVTRGKEFQIEALDALSSIKTKAEQLKERAITHEYEEAANFLLSFEKMATALIDELNMWIAIKEEKYAEAWDFLVNAQMAATDAMRAHSMAAHLEGYMAHLSALEKYIFPDHGFCSMGIIVQKSGCSICGQEYGTCDHLIGKPYMGKICYEVISECELEEISLVRVPGNKHCRVMSFSDGDLMRDTFTLRVVTNETLPDTRSEATMEQEAFGEYRVECELVGRGKLVSKITNKGYTVWCQRCKQVHEVELANLPPEVLMHILQVVQDALAQKS
jgi:hypothetical protein